MQMATPLPGDIRILAGQLHGRLDGFGTAGDKIGGFGPFFQCVKASMVPVADVADGRPGGPVNGVDGDILGAFDHGTIGLVGKKAVTLLGHGMFLLGMRGA